MTRARHLAPAALLLLAMAPAWSWWWLRLGDGSDDPLAPVALLAFLGFLLPDLRRARPGPVDLRHPAAWAVAYAAAVPLAPPLVQAALALGALATTLAALARRPLTTPERGLLVLGLPVLATAQYFLGYPLRRLATELAARLVAPVGIPARVAGVTLELPDATRVVVDAPCSGIRTLWVAAFLALVLAARRRTGAGGTARLLLLAFGGALVANGLRAAGLVLLETGPWPTPPWLHEGVGLVCMATLAGGLVAAAPFVAAPRVTPGGAPTLPITTRGLPAFLVGAALAAAAPWLPSPPRAPAPGFPGFPSHLDGVALEAVPLGPDEARAARGLPGKVGRFRWGQGELVLMWVARPTRALHPARDCYRALGHQVEALPPDADAAGRPRGRLRVRTDTDPRGASLVYEQVVDASGEAYEDVGRWIWAAMLGTSRGPWWALRYQGGGPPPTVSEGMLGARP